MRLQSSNWELLSCVRKFGSQAWPSTLDVDVDVVLVDRDRGTERPPQNAKERRHKGLRATRQDSTLKLSVDFNSEDEVRSWSCKWNWKLNAKISVWEDWWLELTAVQFVALALTLTLGPVILTSLAVPRCPFCMSASARSRALPCF